jgi:hypothetical protein
MTLQELMERITEILPNAIIDEGNGGEILIGSGLREVAGSDELEEVE